LVIFRQPAEKRDHYGRKKRFWIKNIRHWPQGIITVGRAIAHGQQITGQQSRPERDKQTQTRTQIHRTGVRGKIGKAFNNGRGDGHFKI